MTRLDAVTVVGVAGLAGIVDARAWYGLTAAAVRRSVDRPPHPWHWRAAVTLPACSWPQNMIFVDAFHGGLLGDALVRQRVEAFLANGALGQDSQSEQGLRRAAAFIAAAASAWRMPDLHPACQA